MMQAFCRGSGRLPSVFTTTTHCRQFCLSAEPHGSEVELEEILGRRQLLPIMVWDVFNLFEPSSWSMPACLFLCASLPVDLRLWLLLAAWMPVGVFFSHSRTCSGIRTHCCMCILLLIIKSLEGRAAHCATLHTHAQQCGGAIYCPS